MTTSEKWINKEVDLEADVLPVYRNQIWPPPKNVLRVVMLSTSRIYIYKYILIWMKKIVSCLYVHFSSTL